ncbi:DegT/DnrJ/EryC1/StrS family aminotransferase [Clostridium sp. DL1XJH146]
MSKECKREEFLPYALPLIEQEEIDEMVDTLKSGWVSKGPKTVKFEKMFAEFVGAKHAIGTNSATAALHMALVVAGIGPGDEVITTPFTFASTVNTIMHVGATPVFVDINEDTLCIDEEKIEEKITERTKAIVPVHFAGHACNMDKILELGKKYNLLISEDAAHAVYTRYKGKIVGGIGDITSFSFYATKNICTGEGGMITTNDDEIAEKLRVISLHGMSKAAWGRYSKGGSWRYDIEYPGYKYNMTDMQAALGIHQLNKIERMQRRREEIAKAYNNAFCELDGIIIPKVAEYSNHPWHLYTIRINEEKLNINRDDFIVELNDENIGTSVHFIPVHLQPYYKDKFGYKEGDYPVIDAVFNSILSLPLYPKMSDKDVEDVIYAVKRIFDKYKK